MRLSGDSGGDDLTSELPLASGGGRDIVLRPQMGIGCDLGRSLSLWEIVRPDAWLNLNLDAQWCTVHSAGCKC